MRKHYKQVQVVAQNKANDSDRCYTITLDGRSIKTPLKQDFGVPTQDLAEKVKQEWEAQDDKINPETMPMTRIVNTAIDRPAEDMKNLFPFIETDLVLYHSSREELAKRQQKAWEPAIKFVEDKFDVKFETTNTITPVKNEAEAIKKIEAFLSNLPAFKRAAYMNLVPVLGSVILSIYAFEKNLDGDTVFDITHVDEIYQIEKWGEDEELTTRLDNIKKEIHLILEFDRLV